MDVYAWIIPAVTYVFFTTLFIGVALQLLSRQAYIGFKFERDSEGSRNVLTGTVAVLVNVLALATLAWFGFSAHLHLKPLVAATPLGGLLAFLAWKHLK